MKIGIIVSTVKQIMDLLILIKIVMILSSSHYHPGEKWDGDVNCEENNVFVDIITFSLLSR